MLNLDAIHLARLQFAFTVSFHIMFPAISIGMSGFLATLEGLWLKTKNNVYKEMFFFWSKIFAVGFGLGVVSGVVMSYEFGTNWAGFSTVAGSVTGVLLTYEVLTAFFLEAGFLGVMLFGWGRVGERAHFVATPMVAVGTLVSAFWILASNSFMQTPQGYAIENGRIVPVDWIRDMIARITEALCTRFDIQPPRAFVDHALAMIALIDGIHRFNMTMPNEFTSTLLDTLSLVMVYPR